MAIISEEKIAEVRDRSNIVGVLSRYVTLKKAGINFRGLCPFHSEKTPSFVVSEAKKIYHCFGCGKGGNVFTFLMEIGGLSFPEALRKCAQEAGVVIPEVPLTSFQKETKQTKEQFYKINKYALFFFKEELQKNKNAFNFFKKRGLTAEVIHSYHLGYAPPQKQALLAFLKRKGISEKDIATLGLDRFRDRILFPLFDLNQRVLGFGGRALNAETMPKYLNSPESLIYKKGEALYGLSSAISALSKSGVIIVEGYFDCLSMHQIGFQNTVAPMGTALTLHQVEVLKRFTDRFYIFFDHDTAGEQASERSLEIFLHGGIVPKIIQLTAQKDPDEFIQTHGKQSYGFLTQKINEAMSLLEFVMQRILVRCQDLPLQKTKVIEAMIPYLKQVPSDLERQEVVKKISDQLQVDEKWILKPLRQAYSSNTPSASLWKQQMREEEYGVELEVLEFFILFPQWIGKALEEKILDLFADLEIKELILEVVEAFEHKKSVDFSLWVEKIRNSHLKQRFIQGVLEKENQNRTAEEWWTNYQDCVKRLRKKNIERLEKDLLSQIKALEKEPLQEQEKLALLDRYQKLVKQKQQYH